MTKQQDLYGLAYRIKKIIEDTHGNDTLTSMISKEIIKWRKWVKIHPGGSGRRASQGILPSFDHTPGPSRIGLCTRKQTPTSPISRPLVIPTWIVASICTKVKKEARVLSPRWLEGIASEYSERQFRGLKISMIVIKLRPKKRWLSCVSHWLRRPRGNQSWPSLYRSNEDNCYTNSPLN